MTVHSDPRAVDSDGDGLDDDVEIEETHTDPESETTYEITEDHEDFLLDLYNSDVYSPPIMAGTELPLSDVIQRGLTDRWDDFDFVVLDSDEANGANRVVFTAIDWTERSDVWFDNQQEIEHGTDPWDPDTDDDGLTDGWEVEGIITYPPSDFEQSYRFDASPSLNTFFAGTSPNNPDSDNDGFWDGWIGVYGVGYTDNVVLYREHLQSRDGIEGDEIVSEQVGYYEIDGGSAVTGADIDDDGDDEHSNIHIGERHWGGDPLDGAPPETPSLNFEVDYYEEANTEALNTDAWENSVEENFQLYNLDVNLDRDQVLSEEQVTLTGTNGVPLRYDNGGFSTIETALISQEYGPSSGEHLLVMNSSEPSPLDDDDPPEGFHPSENIYAQSVFGTTSWIGLYGAGTGITSNCVSDTTVRRLNA